MCHRHPWRRYARPPPPPGGISSWRQLRRACTVLRGMMPLPVATPLPVVMLLPVAALLLVIQSLMPWRRHIHPMARVVAYW